MSIKAGSPTPIPARYFLLSFAYLFMIRKAFSKYPKSPSLAYSSMSIFSEYSKNDSPFKSKSEHENFSGPISIPPAHAKSFSSSRKTGLRPP